MNTDFFIKQGSSHDMCQDYVVTKPNQVILSDGCSSAKDSDVGARLLALAIANKKLDKLLETSRTLGLDDMCLCATSLSLKLKEDVLEFQRCGDGAFAVGTKDGNVFMDVYSYGTNMPWYYAYGPMGLTANFAQVPYNFCVTTGYTIKNEKAEQVCSSLAEKYNHYTAMPLKDIAWAAVLSDGIDSFSDKNNEHVPITQVIKELFSFKNFHGEFVKRRMNKAFEVFEKNGWKNFDDFSIGVLKC